MKQKKDYLRMTDSLNKRSSRVKNSLFSENAFFDPCDLIQVKYEMLRRVSHEGRAITEVTKEFGFSRPSFYQAKNALTQKGMPGLIPKKKGPRRAHKLDAKKMEYVMKQIEGGMKSFELAKGLAEKFGITIHPRSIERAISKQKKNQTRGAAGGRLQQGRKVD